MDLIKKIEPLIGEAVQDKKLLASIIGLLDLTTLEGTDNEKKVTDLCTKALHFGEMGFPVPAAVCVYPTLVRTAKSALNGSGIAVASVAGAFPSGQSPLSVRTAEVRYAIDEGADEIDMVISRGRFLAGDHDYLREEVSALREACSGAHLKVILETGELVSAENIRLAAELAISAGADFIKTSTGKVQPAATPEAMQVMLETIKNHFVGTGKRIGIKPAGGISTPEQAVLYYLLVKEILGDQWLNNTLFRIGASRLADNLVLAIRQ
jgi:deoxyribose-phosphate aldolase